MANAGSTSAPNPIDSFTVDREAMSFVGEDLQRPECILAERDGSLWTADARGGVVHIAPDGSQRLVTQQASRGFSEAADEQTRFVAGTLPNGLAFARNGDILVSNFGTDRLEVMTRDGDTRVLVDTIDGEPIGKVNFVLRDSRDRVWLTISTRIKNWMRAMSPAIRDGYIALFDQGRLRIVADCFHFTNEIRLDAGEECCTSLKPARAGSPACGCSRTAASRTAKPLGRRTTAPSSTASPSTPTATFGART